VGNGRYLLRQKTGHSTESVCYAAHDLVGGIDVTVELHPDVEEDAGFRLGHSDTVTEQRGLPNLYSKEVKEEKVDSRNDRSVVIRAWRALRSAFRRRK
jgi:hypothetical protein